MASTLVGINKYGNAITPIYTYAYTRSNNQVYKIKQDFNEKKLLQETGAAQHTSYIPSKIMWIKENFNNFNEIDKFIDFSTYVYSKWFEIYLHKSIRIETCHPLRTRRNELRGVTYR